MEQAIQMDIDAANDSYSNPPEFQVSTPSPDVHNLSRDERYLKRCTLFEKPDTSNQFTQTPGIGDLHGLFIRPDLRAIRNFDVTVKDAICTVSVRRAISIPKARIAYQAICEKKIWSSLLCLCCRAKKIRTIASRYCRRRRATATKKSQN